MTVQLLFFAQAARLAGSHGVQFELPAGCTASEAMGRILAAFPNLVEFEGRLQLAVDEEIATPERVLDGAATLAVLPPFSGG